MKIPGQPNQLGVQKLGTPDAGAMRFRANAEQQAALAWGKTFGDMGKDVQQIAMAEGLADANLTLSERVAMDKKSTTQLDAYLVNTPTVDLSRDDVPDSVRKAAAKQGIESGLVDTYLISREAAEMHFEQSRRDSYDAIKEKDSSQKSQTSYNQQMDGVWAGSAKSATQTHILQRIQHLSARADVLYNDALNNLDEMSMTQIVIEAEQNGIWTPEYAADKFNKIGSTVDHVTAERMYRDAGTQADIDLADDFVDASRVEADTRVQLGARSTQMQDRQYNLSIRAQGKNYGDAHAMLIRGELTKGMVAEMADNQKISGSHANTLINAMDTIKPVVSDQRTYNNLMRGAIGLRFSSADSSPDDVRARAQSVREDIQMAATGVMPGGTFEKPTITGDDMAKLMDEVDEQENKALGKGGIEYGVAIKQIRQMSGYSNEIAEALGGNHPQARSYTDMQTALQDYMNANPGSANPLEWVAANGHKYTAEKYANLYSDTLTLQFPRYKAEIHDIVTGSTSKLDLTRNGVKITTVPTAGALLNRARMDALNGTIDWSDFERLRRGLAYKYEGGAALTKPESANNE